MGYPIKNISFDPKSPSQEYFKRFPIQVAILFKPTDRVFTEYLASRFVDLDRSTGNNLAFFAVLDPPAEWLQERINSQWWRTYQQRAGSFQFTTDERVLMKEIARLFGMPWHSLPVIVVSTNLWRAEHVTCPTSLENLDIQLNELAKLPDKYGIPNVGHIINTLKAICGDEVDYNPPNELTRQRLKSFYDILNTFDLNQGFDNTTYHHELDRQLNAVENRLGCRPRYVQNGTQY